MTISDYILATITIGNLYGSLCWWRYTNTKKKDRTVIAVITYGDLLNLYNSLRIEDKYKNEIDYKIQYDLINKIRTILDKFPYSYESNPKTEYKTTL